MNKFDSIFVNRATVLVLGALAVTSPVTWTLAYVACLLVYGLTAVVLFVLAMSIYVGLTWFIFYHLRNSLTASSRNKRPQPLPVAIERPQAEEVFLVPQERAPLVAAQVVVAEPVKLVKANKKTPKASKLTRAGLNKLDRDAVLALGKERKLKGLNGKWKTETIIERLLANDTALSVTSSK